ncbi:MAG: HAMP domain-containing histidine kinase [Clostridia bacterium]|nr:HAMP domain-containing histidine kinase [Clostridia bacterium]
MTLVIVGLVFAFLAQFYTENQSKKQLIKDANTIFDSLKNEIASGKNKPGINARQELRKKAFSEAGMLESNFALVSKDLKILYPKNEDAQKFKEQVLPRIMDKFNSSAKKTVSMKVRINNIEHLLVILPPRNNVSQSLKGWIVMYNQIGPIQKMLRSLLSVLLISLTITALIAVAVGIFIARSIAKPIILLKNRAAALSKLSFDGKVEIRTGDELEDLGETINRMAAELKEHDIAQKRFFQNASHELKTPLMSIQGYAEGVKDGVFDDNNEALDIIVEESKRLKGIVEELLFLSKVESQEDFYKFSIESMNGVIESCVEKLRGLSNKENIRIGIVLCKDVMINIDHDKITQALINVLGNCLRYAKSEINILTSVNAKFFEITIQDDGEGFQEQNVERIFERFYKGKSGNSGLGLTITKVIIEKHNGFIEASNRKCGGAEFRIKLPIT